MTVRVGPYEFRDVIYDPNRDVLDLSIEGLGGVGDDDTPEGHTWFVENDESDEIVALQIIEPRRAIELDGALYVTLPTGERVVAQGVEEVLTRPS
jgi:hypothetical protein